MSNNTNSNNNTNPPGLEALAALYNSLGASTGRDSRHPAAAAQALASLASSQPSNQAQGPGGPSPSPYGLQSLYAQQVQQQQLAAAQTQHQQQQLAAAQTQHQQQQNQQQQQAQNYTLLKSLPTELLQAYLASTASQSLPSSLLNNAPQAQQPPQQNQQQQLYAQAQAIAAQILAASAQAKLDVQRPLSVPGNISSVLRGDLMGALARSGSVSNGVTAANGPDPGLLNQIQAQAAAQSNAAPATAAAAKPNPSVAAKTDAPAAKAPSNHPKKRLKSLAAADSSQVKQPVQAASSAAKGQDDSDDKKIAKRAANRLSAHLSRKRKKMYIDDVTTENIDLRRKVQILQSIPDLVVAFDSSGCISFVSRSVPAFLETQASELEGASFWDYLTEDSVNVIKSAFMDALAEKRNPDDDSTLLCHGESLLIKLVDKEGNEPSLVSFKGVVHFTDNAPECISSMRPVAVNSVSSSPQDFNDAQLQEATKNVLPANASTHDISDVESRKAATSNDSSGSSSE